jgi:hypothetical protein
VIVDLDSFTAFVAWTWLMNEIPTHCSWRHFSCLLTINNSTSSTFDMIFGCGWV